MTVPPLADSPLQIIDVTVEVASTSSKCILSMDIKIDDVKVKGRLLKPKNRPGLARDLTFVLDRPMVAATSLSVTAYLRYKNFWKYQSRDPEFTINADELQRVSSRGTLLEKKEWRGTYEKLSIIVGLRRETLLQIEPTLTSEGSGSVRNEPSLDYREPTLTPTTENILRDCPQFRILVMGKTGVGKSKLINKTFGVNDAIVSHYQPGDADINKEIYSAEDAVFSEERELTGIDKEISSPENSHFILHDSRGFEAGDDANVTIVQNFIHERNDMPLIKDKLHAVWLCIDIPLAGGRLLERGIERFLKLKMEGELGPVPVIAVFTKYDNLVTNVRRKLKADERTGKSKEEIEKLIEQKANAILQKLCLDPFDELVKKKIPHVTVSAENGHEARLSNLVRVTYEQVRDHLPPDASVVTAMAQRINPEVKLMASIEVGRRKYWQRLATSVNFPGKNLQQCLEVIHIDIVKVWQFHDPENHLTSPSFKALMSNIVSQRGAMQTRGDPGRNLAAGLSFAAGVIGIVSVLAGPAAPIVIPIAASFVLARWVYDMYLQTTDVLRFLMAYIIDLTLILQNIFWLQEMAGAGNPLSRRLIKTGARAYFESNTKQTISFKIDKHLEGVSFHLGPDTTLSTIVELIKSCIINPADIFAEKAKFAALESVEDEAWETPTSGTQSV